MALCQLPPGSPLLQDTETACECELPPLGPGVPLASFPCYHWLGCLKEPRGAPGGGSSRTPVQHPSRVSKPFVGAVRAECGKSLISPRVRVVGEVSFLLLFSVVGDPGKSTRSPGQTRHFSCSVHVSRAKASVAWAHGAPQSFVCSALSQSLVQPMTGQAEASGAPRWWGFCCCADHP